MHVNMLKLFLLAYDNADGGDAGNGDKGAGGDKGADGDKGGTPPAKTFTQAQVNQMLADNKRALQQSNQTLAAQLEELRNNVNMTQEQKDGLEIQIQQLKDEGKTALQLAKEGAAKIQREFDAHKTGSAKEVETWKNRFTSMLTENAIRAAVGDDAYNPDQFLQIMKPMTKVAPVLGDDGKPTDQYKVVISMTGKNEKGETIDLELDPAAAVTRMKEDVSRFGNLFKSGIKGGLNGGNVTTAGNIDLSKLTPEQYREHRKKNRAVLGL